MLCNLAHLVEETTAFRGAFRGALGVGGCVNVNVVRGALKKVRIRDSPPYNIDIDGAVWEVVIPIDPLEPCYKA